MYAQKGSYVAPLARGVLECAGIEFLDGNTVRFPKSWNRDLQVSMRPYQRTLRTLEKLQCRARRLEAANERDARSSQ